MIHVNSKIPGVYSWSDGAESWPKRVAVTQKKCYPEKVESITAKELHQETKRVLDQLERGRPVVITRNGRVVARLEAITGDEPPQWDELMADVWAAQTKVTANEIVENPVLAERRRRRR